MTKIRFTSLFALLFIAFPILQSCTFFSSEKKVEGNRKMVNHLIDVKDFNKIRMDCIGEIIYKQISEEEPYFQITTDENILPYLDLKVEDNCLIISRNDTIIAPSKLTIYTNSKNLEKITLCDSAVILLAGEVNAKRMDMNISGKAQVSMDSLLCREIFVEVAGNGKVNLAGASGKTFLRTKENGVINLDKFFSEIYAEYDESIEG
jgi:hypothetical protein